MKEIVKLLLLIPLLNACTKSKTVYISPTQQPLPQEFKQACKTAKELMNKPQTEKQIAELIVRQDTELKNCEAKRAGVVRVYER